MSFNAATPTVYNVTLASANTEYSQLLPAGITGIKRFKVQCRTATDVKLAYKVGESGTNFFTIKAGSVYVEEDLQADVILYMQATVANTVVEIICWR